MGERAMASAPAQIIKARALTREAYRPYGEVIAADEALPFKPANFGRSKRFNWLADVLNLRPEARLNLCVFRCEPFVQPEIQLQLLEKHPHSTQVFMPMHDGTYVTIVARGGAEPDLTTLAAFIVKSPQGISYNPGTWHYPMTALGQQLDMACLVFEDKTKDDCVVSELNHSVLIHL
jgi:ureidoglycolate hydrolase